MSSAADEGATVEDELNDSASLPADAMTVGTKTDQQCHILIVTTSLSYITKNKLFTSEFK